MASIKAINIKTKNLFSYQIPKHYREPNTYTFSKLTMDLIQFL